VERRRALLCRHTPGRPSNTWIYRRLSTDMDGNIRRGRRVSNPNFSTCSCTSRGAKVLATGHGA